MEHFVADELPQYAKLTMSLLQSFKFHNSRDNPTASFNIYHKVVDMRLSEFCREIKVPSWGTSRTIKEDSREFKFLLLGFCQGNNRITNKGRIRNIQFPAVRYLAYYISRGILARGNASKISTPDLVILDAALTGNKTYNIGALIAQRLSTNSVKGPFYGGIIASRLLSYSGLSIDPTDIKH